MKKLLLPILLLFVLILAACNNEPSDGRNKRTAAKEKPTTITYESEEGPIEVPADPQRVVVVSSYAGNVSALDVNLVGVDAWSKKIHDMIAI